MCGDGSVGENRLRVTATAVLLPELADTGPALRRSMVPTLSVRRGRLSYPTDRFPKPEYDELKIQVRGPRAESAGEGDCFVEMTEADGLQADPAQRGTDASVRRMFLV